MHAAKAFRGTAWVAYDRLYRRQAASQRSLDWGLEDSALYNEAFVGQAKVITRCNHCLSDNHQTEECPEFLAGCLLAPRRFMPPQPHITPSQEVCRRFNEGRCNYPACKYKHTCSNCGSLHPAISCATDIQKPKVRDRSPLYSPRGARNGIRK